jgi:hypothetical protein
MTNLSALKTELETDPAALGYAPFLSNSPGLLADKLNAQTGNYTKVVSRLIGIGTVMDVLGPIQGATLLNGLEALKSSNSVIKWAWYLLENGNLDVGLESTRAQLDFLVTAGVITSQQSTTIKNLAVVPASRAESLFGNNTYIRDSDIRNALTGQ